jgi:hypothetical protein
MPGPTLTATIGEKVPSPLPAWSSLKGSLPAAVVTA